MKLVDDNKISIYPNPAYDIITFDNDKRIESVGIYSVTGQLVLEKIMDSDRRMNIFSLKSGMYIIKMRIENKMFKEKILKK